MLFFFYSMLFHHLYQSIFNIFSFNTSYFYIDSNPYRIESNGAQFAKQVEFVK